MSMRKVVVRACYWAAIAILALVARVTGLHCSTRSFVTPAISCPSGLLRSDVDGEARRLPTLCSTQEGATSSFSRREGWGEYLSVTQLVAGAAGRPFFSRADWTFTRNPGPEVEL